MAVTQARVERRSDSALTPGFFVKMALLAVTNALAVYAMISLAAKGKWIYLVMLVVATILINLAFATRRVIPLKYLVPGLLLMFLFQLYPVGYTIATALTNYGSGNLLSQAQAIDQIKKNSREITDESPRFSMKVLQNATGDIHLLLEDPNSGDLYLATKDTYALLSSLPAKVVKDDSGTIKSIDGYNRLRLKDIGGAQASLDAFVSKSPAGEVRPTSATEAAVSSDRYKYDSGKDQFTDLLSGEIFVPKSGTYTSTKNADNTLSPGFKAFVGGKNFSDIAGRKEIRKPFIRIFIWNFVFAGASVLATVAIGLFLAVTLNHPKLRGKAIYRQLLVIPYALPPFMMILVWSQGLLNPKYGYINKTFGWGIQWLQNPWLAKLAIVIVNTWLGFPYMFLLCTGLLSSVPSDIYEAARVDGATGFQQFRKVTLPILLVGLSPMLISSFAFSFNNFLPVYLMTGGGPPVQGGEIGGETDILVSYTYKLAFASGKGTQYGLAAAVAIIIFIIVGTLSGISFRQTKAFKELS
jgi:arabinogalactan oligomer / maltooligosaccharide transport system permease protein